MKFAVTLVTIIFRLALVIGIGEALVDMTGYMREEAIKAHQRGPISYQRFTRELWNQK